MLSDLYDFAALVRAQAIGDGNALRVRGRPVLRVNLSGDTGAALRELTALVRETLGTTS